MDQNNNQVPVFYGWYQLGVIPNFSRLLEQEEEAEEEQEQQQQQMVNQVSLELPDVANDIVEQDQQNDGGAMELKHQHIRGDNHEVQASQEKEGNHQQQDALNDNVKEDRLRGQRAMTDDEDKNGTDPDNDNAGTSQISERKAPSSNPVSSNLQTNHSEQTKPQSFNITFKLKK